MGLQGHACVVEGSGNRDDTATGKTIGVGVRVPGSGLDEVGDSGLDGVESTNGVNVDDSLESVGAQTGDGSNEVSSSTSDDKVDGAQLLDATFSRRLEVLELRNRSATVAQTPSQFTQATSLTFLTSTLPMPMTRAPERTLAMSLAAFSVFSALRPIMQASPPKWTKARVCALQMVPAPPVTKRTRLAVTESVSYTVYSARFHPGLTKDAGRPDVAEIL